MQKRIGGQCEKIEVHSDGTATLGCRSADGQPITRCGEAPDYRDSAMPFSEQLCLRRIAAHEPHMNDAYKQPYISVCHHLDETMADPFKAGSCENLRLRFEVMERDLQAMINDPELEKGDNGRYLYHIDARMVHAYLPAFWYRAEHGLESDMPTEIIHDTYQKLAAILEDFSSLYENVAMQVALRRTEVEILALLLRTKSPDFFPFPTLFREDASETRENNHDAYLVSDKRKTTIQITNTDYRMRNGKRKSQSYDPATVIAIHQQVVNLDYKDGETVVTRVADNPRLIAHEHDVVDVYEEFDEQPRYVAWGAIDAVNASDTDDDFSGEYIQHFGGNRRDGLVRAIVKEASGHRVSPEERNLLNGASHYLMAIIREKEQQATV
ncbi:MAG TPA: hypothetical protein VGE13_01260 [Candidatus Saccharimonadales bacterium]